MRKPFPSVSNPLGLGLPGWLSAQHGREGNPTETTFSHQLHLFFGGGGWPSNQTASASLINCQLSTCHVFFFSNLFSFLHFIIVVVLGAMPQCAYGTLAVRLIQQALYLVNHLTSCPSFSFMFVVRQALCNSGLPCTWSTPEPVSWVPTWFISLFLLSF